MGEDRGKQASKMDARMGEDRLRGLGEAVVGWEVGEEWANKRILPVGVEGKLPGVSVGCLVGGITGQRIMAGGSRQGSPMWQKSKRLQLTSSPSGTRDSEGGLCR